ncbi:GSCFA domain-containing protein [Shimia sp. R10_1]|uniref:GSCFA domain-containing protein n=1 Tax=Shimia sp. R10_1 TaxID=2821095 RepID=UPI001ADC9229|nr:GSCFA domain-containing protein [Shimia sp. R10_1]MBO9473258.1 GSCFA domain-containing protein [Shimia sp. R10_1]
MNSPYSNLPKHAFWSSGVAERAPLDPGTLYSPDIMIDRKARVVTAGSCFAQHVGRSLREAGMNVLDAEPIDSAVSDTTANQYGYRLYSARYGNIYTVRQMLQLLREAFGSWQPENIVWEKDDRFFDALRPSVEPLGLPTREDVLDHRAEHLKAVREVFSNFDVFIFTLGLTEAWVSKGNGTTYPTCPGTIAGTFDSSIFQFHNFKYLEIKNDFLKVRRLIKTRVPHAKFVLTVSPVPLTATASRRHVEVATIYSKSVLRAVAGELSDRLKDVEYFPSFEIITSQNARGSYFEANLRNVSRLGVETAMSQFMTAHNISYSPRRNRALQAKKEFNRNLKSGAQDLNEICEDLLLKAFIK